MGDRTSSHHRSLAVARLAGRQHGIVAARQLAELGCSRTVVAGWCKAGRLHRLHRGVYAVGHRSLGSDGRRLAAVLACGDGALASHTTAAAIWGLAHDSGRDFHVSVHAARGVRTRPGIIVHHPGTLLAADGGNIRGIAVTSVARTLADLGEVVRATRVRSAFVAAERGGLLDMNAVEEQLSRAPGRRGCRILAELVRAWDPRWADARSNVELAMLDIVSDAGLPAAEVNAWIDGRYVADLLWRRPRLIVEVDSERFHGSPLARRADAHRDRELRRLGFTVARVTESEIESRPAIVAARLIGLLAEHANHLG